MVKKGFLLLFTMLLLVVFTGCGKSTTAGDAAKADAPQKIKIGIMTTTVAQNEEEYRAAEKMVKKYGKDVILFKTTPDNFMKEQETTIANMLAFAADPDCKAIIMCPAVPGCAAAFEKVREVRPDMLLIAGAPNEDPDMVAKKADVILNVDELAMGKTIPAQAKKLGATTLVHYSFPRHMSYPLLAQRRDIMRVESEKLGLKFIDATAPDPLGDAGVPGAQQFILEDVPRKVNEFGKNTNFFNTNCAMQEPLIKATLDAGGLDAQQCCPSPFHGYPGALGIQIPPEKAGDVSYVLEQIKAKIAEKNGTGRFSTWPVPVNMSFIEAGVEYSKDWAEGKFKEKNNKEVLMKKLSEAAGTKIEAQLLKTTDKSGKETTLDNFYLILIDYVTL
ncbi:DUF3798 domain-containing protein [Sporomusa acidovorans]|uniref:DUF3798 domain-containing protein n=1 Tax=Sporomusa acidovorans (strain ATCC 49682 / DSM 3132 / Mol) TaxID=1123286 RepID=A0ABZ3JBU2_SPOA4|nr:DUF3798 domain-containing protein [Sporomusa acidovorans]OZC13333.1 hypothetical protein SPACI_58290 [Sporomusa acidovorans DSM 3132]SDD96149.1 Protein of unknown function [Sporomusa acidovorans]